MNNILIRTYSKEFLLSGIKGNLFFLFFRGAITFFGHFKKITQLSHLLKKDVILRLIFFLQLIL